MYRPLSIIPPSTNMSPHVDTDYMSNRHRDRPGRFMACEYTATLSMTDKSAGTAKGDKVTRAGVWDTRMHPKVLAAQRNNARDIKKRLTKRQLQ